MVTTLSWPVRRQFYENASSQILNGLTLQQALDGFRLRLMRRGKQKAAEALHQVHRKVKDGKTFVVAMGDCLTDLERGLLASGEKAGDLPGAMQLVLTVRERMGRVTSKLVASFFSPVVYLVVLYAVLRMIGQEIVPSFAQVLPAEKWTGWAYAMYIMGQAAVGWRVPAAVSIVVVVVGGTAWALPRWTGRARTFCDRHIFPFTTYRDVAGVTWLLAFSALVRALPETSALQDQISTASPWLASRLRPVVAGLKNGLDMATAMRRAGMDFPSPELIDEIGAYVGFTDFPQKIEAVANRYAEKLERELARRGAWISAGFSGLLFFAFIVMQLGANSLSTALTSAVGG
ncbi:type II secretion system protein [Cupriavidus sp. UYMSc13B]|nr:type II secretion system protein [Cupriavidus sp. UYMSc13B]